MRVPINRMLLLEITSYKGISIGAVHYYGAIRPDYRSVYQEKAVELDYVVKPKHIELMKQSKNKWELDEELFWYQVGSKSGRFWNKEDIIKAGIKHFKENYDPDVDYLVQWDSVYPWNSKRDKILIGDKRLIKAVKKCKSDREVDTLMRSDLYSRFYMEK